MEKQISEMKNNNQALLLKNREMQSRMTEQSNTIDSLKSQLEQLNGQLRNRDASLAKESAARRDFEIEIERLHVKVDEAKRTLESNKPVESENGQLEALRVCYFAPSAASSVLMGCSKSLCAQYAGIASRILQFELAVMFFASNAPTNELLRDRENVRTAAGASQPQTLSRFICNTYHSFSIRLTETFSNSVAIF